MDITDSLAPTSDQLDAIELVSGPRIFTVDNVTRGSAEQPVQIYFKDFPRPWRPSKGMRRVLAFCWSSDASTWSGRRVELFFDPEVTFGKDKPGGTRISRLSHIDGPKKIPLLVTRGKSALFAVDPLPDAPTLTEAEIACSTDKGQLGDWWRQFPAMRAQIEARVAEINADVAAGERS
jgi:hypothetical protein